MTLNGCSTLAHTLALSFSAYPFDKDATDRITVDGTPLIFYHFHQFQLLENGKFDRLSTFYTSECAEPAAVYEIYEAELKKCLADVRTVVPDFKGGLKPVSSVRGRRFIQQFVPMWAKEIARRFFRY